VLVWTTTPWMLTSNVERLAALNQRPGASLALCEAMYQRVESSSDEVMRLSFGPGDRAG
jgi:isoleucyl-tRNA synthetase